MLSRNRPHMAMKSNKTIQGHIRKAIQSKLGYSIPWCEDQTLLPTVEIVISEQWSWKVAWFLKEHYCSARNHTTLHDHVLLVTFSTEPCHQKPRRWRWQGVPAAPYKSYTHQNKMKITLNEYRQGGSRGILREGTPWIYLRWAKEMYSFICSGWYPSRIT